MSTVFLAKVRRNFANTGKIALSFALKFNFFSHVNGTVDCGFVFSDVGGLHRPVGMPTTLNIQLIKKDSRAVAPSCWIKKTNSQQSNR